MTSENRAGSVVAIWRYPVKSMQGEELNATAVTERGLLGDRGYALLDSVDGKIVSAKNPRKWPNFFDFRASLVDAPRLGHNLPPVRITLPDGISVSSEQADLNEILSRTLGRGVAFTAAASRGEGAKAEEYWPDMEGLDYRETVTDFDLPNGTFFDSAVVHLLTTATLDRLQELYPAGRFEVRRFRPNVVVKADDPVAGFAENAWVGRTLAIGDSVRLLVTDPCPRCVMTTLAQADLPSDPGILRTAAQHNGVNVGVYASVLQGGIVRRGDNIELV